MTRLVLAVAAGAATALVVFAGGAARAHFAAVAAQRPNIVVIETDDQTLESMKVMERTQRLLGTEGVTFDNNVVSFSLCCPSRATFLTGQYAHNHTVLGNGPPDGGYYKLDSTNTLAVWLQRSGYTTALVGKYLNRYGTKDPREGPAGASGTRLSIRPRTSTSTTRSTRTASSRLAGRCAHPVT